MNNQSWIYFGIGIIFFILSFVRRKSTKTKKLNSSVDVTGSGNSGDLDIGSGNVINAPQKSPVLEILSWIAGIIMCAFGLYQFFTTNNSVDTEPTTKIDFYVIGKDTCNMTENGKRRGKWVPNYDNELKDTAYYKDGVIISN